MQLPIIILTIMVLLFGILPGIPLKVVNAIGISFGLQPLDLTLWGIASDTGSLNLINLFAAIIIAGAVVWLIVRPGRKTYRVSQDDSYAAGAAVPVDKYHFTVDFYKPLTRMIDPFLKDWSEHFSLKLSDWSFQLSGLIRKIYSGFVGQYVMYIIFFAAVLIFIQLKWSPW
jgi:hypothetical protein